MSSKEDSTFLKLESSMEQLKETAVASTIAETMKVKVLWDELVL